MSEDNFDFPQAKADSEVRKRFDNNTKAFRIMLVKCGGGHCVLCAFSEILLNYLCLARK